MANKENKAVGYLVLSIIPIIGIVWAGIAGIRHNTYVKDAKKVEDQFEEKLVTLVNDLDDIKTNNIKIEKLNVTSVLGQFYETKLKNDRISTNNSSYTVKLSANPLFKDSENGQVLDKFQFNYEFFVTQADYSNLIEHYSKDTITTVGTKDYVFETYYENNPKSSPIYVLNDLVDKYYKEVLYLDYNDDVIVGTSTSSVIDLIEDLPADLTSNEADLNNFKSILDDIQGQYNLLSKEEQNNVTNIEKFNQAKELYDAKIIERDIEKDLPKDWDSYKLSHGNKVDKLYDRYNKLSDENKAKVLNKDLLEEVKFNHPIWKVQYYQRKNDLSNLNKAIDLFNALTDDQIKDTVHGQVVRKDLVDAVNAYNATAADDAKITKEIKDVK